MIRGIADDQGRVYCVECIRRNGWGPYLDMEISIYADHRFDRRVYREWDRPPCDSCGADLYPKREPINWWQTPAGAAYEALAAILSHRGLAILRQHASRRNIIYTVYGTHGIIEAITCPIEGRSQRCRAFQALCALALEQHGIIRSEFIEYHERMLVMHHEKMSAEISRGQEILAANQATRAAHHGRALLLLKGQ